MNTVTTHSGTKWHYTSDGLRTLCGKAVSTLSVTSNEGDGCKTCIRNHAKQSPKPEVAAEVSDVTVTRIDAIERRLNTKPERKNDRLFRKYPALETVPCEYPGVDCTRFASYHVQGRPICTHHFSYAPDSAAATSARIVFSLKYPQVADQSPIEVPGPDCDYCFDVDDIQDVVPCPRCQKTTTIEDDPVIPVIPDNLIHMMKNAHTSQARDMWIRICTKKYGQHHVSEALKTR